MSGIVFNRSEAHTVLKALAIAMERAGEFDKRGARLRVQVRRKIAAFLIGLDAAPPGTDVVRLRDELAMLNGRPPYNHPSNICWNDNYYAESLRTKYGVDLATLERWAQAGVRTAVTRKATAGASPELTKALNTLLKKGDGR